MHTLVQQNKELATKLQHCNSQVTVLLEKLQIAEKRVTQLESSSSRSLSSSSDAVVAVRHSTPHQRERSLSNSGSWLSTSPTQQVMPALSAYRNQGDVVGRIVNKVRNNCVMQLVRLFRVWTVQAACPFFFLIFLTFFGKLYCSFFR